MIRLADDWLPRLRVLWAGGWWKWQGRTALLLVAVACGVFPSAASADDAEAGFDWFGLGGCTLPVIGMPVDFHNVAPDIPAEHQSRLITLGSGEQRQALLIFVLGRCPTNSLRRQAGSVSRGDVVQVMIGALYGAGTSEDADKAQFYLLTSAINWEPFVAAEQLIGLPTYFDPALGLRVDRNPLTGTGTFVATVPSGEAMLTASGQLVAPNPVREFDLDAAHFFQGPRGLVRVHHDESWAVGNGAQATIRAPSGSRVARWMGTTTGSAWGFYYWDHDTRHVHRYRLLGEGAHPPGNSSAPNVTTRCAAVRARRERWRVRCAVNVSHNGELAVRLTRRRRLYAYARRSLRAGRRTIALGTRRRLVAGNYRLTTTIRTTQGSSTRSRFLRIRRHRRR